VLSALSRFGTLLKNSVKAPKGTPPTMIDTNEKQLGKALWGIADQAKRTTRLPYPARARSKIRGQMRSKLWVALFTI